MLRPLRWPDDRAAVEAMDTSFTTSTIFRVLQDDRSARLDAVAISPPLHKRYSFVDEGADLPRFDHAVVAELHGQIVGIAALSVEAWNRRAVLWHCYVAGHVRKQGIGRRLIEDACAFADEHAARCLWLETQNVNVPAILFYERMGFHWCGFDTTLYDAGENIGDEIALYFARSCRGEDVRA